MNIKTSRIKTLEEDKSCAVALLAAVVAAVLIPVVAVALVYAGAVLFG